MEGVQKRKAGCEPAPQGTAAVRAGAEEKQKWEEIFRFEGNGKYSMEQWKPSYNWVRNGGNRNQILRSILSSLQCSCL